ncbi:MFS transporter [Nocardia beijingensis]
MQAERRANAGNYAFDVPLLAFDPTTLVSRVGLRMHLPGSTHIRFWHVRVGPDDTAWGDRLFEPGPPQDALMAVPGRRSGRPVFELTVGPRGVDGERLAAAEMMDAALDAGQAVTEWLRLRAWRSGEQIAAVRAGVAERVWHAFAHSTGEVRVVARTNGTKFGERELVVEVIDNNPEASAVQDVAAVRQADDGGVLSVEGGKGIWLRFAESMIHRLLPPDVRAYEMLGERYVRHMGTDPGLMCGRVILGNLGYSASEAPAFQEEYRPDPLPWPPGVVGAVTPLFAPDNYAAAVAGSATDFRAIGIGIGDNKPFRVRGVADGERLPFATADEWAWLRSAGGPVHGGVHLERLLRAAKDSVGEATDALVREPISETDIDIAIDLRAGTFQARLRADAAHFLGSPVEQVPGRFHVRDGIVLALAWVPREDEVATPAVGDRAVSTPEQPAELPNAFTGETESPAQPRPSTPWSRETGTATGHQAAAAPSTPWDRAAQSNPAAGRQTDDSQPQAPAAAHATPWHAKTPVAQPPSIAAPATGDESAEATRRPQPAKAPAPRRRSLIGVANIDDDVFAEGVELIRSRTRVAELGMVRNDGGGAERGNREPTADTTAAQGDGPAVTDRPSSEDDPESDAPRARAKPIADIGILPREVEVLDMTLQGLSRDEIAARLGLRPDTVTNYRASAAKKLGTVGVIATVVEAKRWGFLSDTGTEESTLFTVSDRDRELLQLLAEGKTDQQIARLWKVTPETVGRRSARIGAELGAAGQVPMVMKALRLGIITVDSGGIATEPPEHSPSPRARSGSAAETTGQPLIRHVLPADVHTAEILDSERSPALTVRLSAEQLLGDLGLQNEPMPLAPEGKPRWPADLVGDTAGTGRYAAAAAAPGQMYRAIGLDAKDHEPVSRSAIPRITRHRERLHLRDLSSAHPGIYWAQVLASAKDNAIGVQFGLTEAELSQNEIEVVLRPDPEHPDSGSFDVLPATAQSDASTQPLFSGRFRVGGGTVLTAITVRNVFETSELSRDPDSALRQRGPGATLAAPKPADPGRSTEEPVYTEVAAELVPPEQTAPARPRTSDPVHGLDQAARVEPDPGPTTPIEDDPPAQAASDTTPSESTKASVQPSESLPALSSGTATDAVTETPTTATTRDEPAPRPVALSDVETEILRRLVSGKYISEIAAELSISAATVSTHAQHIHRKLRAGNPAQLVEAARGAGVDLSAPAEQPEAGAAGFREPAAARSTGLIGGVPDLVNPFDDHGAPWDRGGPVPRHERIERLAQAHADGGGFARGKQPTPPADDSRQGDQPSQESSGRDDDAIDQHLWLEEAHGERQLAEQPAAGPPSRAGSRESGDDAQGAGKPSPDGDALVAVEAAAKAALEAAARGEESQFRRLQHTIRRLGNPEYEHYLERHFLQGLPVADATAAISGNRTADAVKSLRYRAVRALAARLPLSPAELLRHLGGATTLAELVNRIGWTPAVTQSLRAAILSGRLAEDRMLPVSTAFAEQLGLASRDVVDNAYGQLSREGYVVIQRPLGTRIASHEQWPSTPPPDVALPVTVEEMVEIFEVEAPIRDLLKATDELHLSVQAALRRALLSDRLTGRTLPTAEQLGAALHMSRHPVEKAYRQLRIEGYLVSTPGSGTRVKNRDQWPIPSPRPRPSRAHGLSELEIEVLELTAKGLSAREIAAAAEITPKKVHYSYERIRLALGVHGDHDALVAVAKRRGIIGTDDDPRARYVSDDGEEPGAPSEPPEPTEDAPRPAIVRPTALTGGVPDLVNPLDDRGAPWDRGGQVPRHQRTNRLAETNNDGGGFGRGNQSDPDNAPRHGAGPNQVRYSDLLFNPTPEEAAAAAVRDLPTNTGPLGPELNLDFLPFFASDGLKTEEDVETVATAVGEMLREHNWRDTAQLEAAAELVRAAGLNAVTYMTSYTRALQRAGVSQWDEERALHGIQAKLMLRLSTQAGSRSLYMALEIDQYRPERSPDDEIFTWPAPLFSDTQVEAGVRTLLGSATVSDVEQWGEIWARFDEPRSDGDDALDEPPPRGDLEAKARIARRLYDDHHIRILGWEESIVPLQAVESVDRALRDRIAEYGSRFALRDVTFDDIEEFGLTRSFGTTTPDAKDHYTSITINRRIFTDPEVRREWAEQVRNHRYAESAEDMIYQLTHHEFIHVVVDDGNWMLHAPAMALLRSAYALYRDSELIPADLEFTEWLALLPHYALLSYIHPETETFYPVEGVAEGARAGAVESSLALTDPARILHWLTVTRDGSSPAPTLAQWAKRQAAVVGEGRDVLLLLHDFRDVTGRDDIEVPAELRPQDTTADVLEAATGGGLRHFTDVGEVIARLRAGGQSPDSPDDAVSALVVEDGRPYLLVRRATGSGTGRVEVRNPGEGVLRANHFLPVGSSDLPSVRAMFFDENGRPVSNDGTRPDTPAPAPAPSGQPTTPNPERGTASGPDPSPSGSSPDAPPALDLVSVTIPQLIEMLDSGQITSVQLTQVCLERIESLSALHAVIGLNPRALEEARRADELRRTGAGHSPLLGVPVLIKGSIDIEGMPTTAGSVALAQSYPAADATLVQQLRAAGAVILGHTNLTEFAFYLGSEVPRGYSSYGGQTLNPYDVSLLPGGSSSGSAVAVAAGLVPLAIGTQTIGSILEPCNYNSVVGFKPTVGAVSRTGVLPIATSRDSPGVISPDVTGAAVSLTAIVGVDPEDPATARNPLAGHDFTADLDPNALRGARIGILAAGIPAEDAPQRPLWDAVLDTLAAQGATLVPIDLDLNDSFRDNDPPWSSVFSYEFKRDLNAYLSRLPSDAPMKSLADIIAYNNAHAETALKYGQDRALSAEAMDLAPDSADTAKYRADLQLDLAESKDRIDAVMAEHNLTALASIYNFGTVIGDKPGYPCVIVPAGRTPADDEHPAGEHVNVTFRAGAWSEPTLIGYAYAFEQAHAVSRPRPLYADQLSRAAASKSAVAPQPDKTRGGSLRPADSSSTARQVTARGPAEDAAPQPGPAVARPTTLAGGAPVLENPFDDRGAPWDRGGRMPRHQRTNRLAELNVDGGGFSRARKGGDDPDSNPADEHTAPGPARDSAPAGNETHARPQPAVQRQPTDPAADEQVSIRQLLVVNKPFAKLLLGERIVWPPGEVANKFGTVIATSALPYVVLNETESAMAAGMAGAALWIPGLFELPAGYAADFVNRRKLMIAAQLLGAAAAATAAGLVFFEAPDLGPALTAATLAEATAAIFYLRAFDAAARDFLIKAHRDAGARLRTLTGQAADILGPALGPALANGVATWAPFGFNTLSYLGNLLNMRGVAFPPQTRRVPRNLLRELGEGAQTLWQEKFLRDVTAISAINNAAWAMLGLRTATVLHDADLAGWATGAVVAAPAVGGLMSDFVVRAFDKMDLSTLYQVGLANMAVFSVLQASTAEPAVIAVASAVDAMMMWASNTRMAVYQQQAIPEQLQGRAGSVKGLFLRTGPAAGLLAAGALTASHGGDAAATVGAGITVATAAGYAALTLLRRGRGAARDAPAADPEVIANCAIHLARVFRALALTHDGSPEPDDTDPRWDSRKNWRLVEAALGAQLRPAAYDGDPRFSAVAETVRTKRDGIDLAVVVVDDGENAHPYTFVNVEGEVLVFDTLVDNTDSDLPRVRSYDGDENGEHKWEPKYHKVVQVFDAYYTSNAGTPSPVRKPVPRYRHIRHPHKIQGPPAYPPPQTGSGSPTDRTGDSRTDGERPARQTLSSPSATNSSATRASRTVGNAGRPDGRGFISGGIRTSPAGLIVPADPTAGLIVPAAYVIPADPSLEELMERLRPWKEIFHYFWEFPLPREGELSGREWIESAERKAWMRRRALRRTPLYAGVDAAVRLTLGAERLLGAPNATPGPATIEQRRVIPGRGPIDAGKNRTMRYDTQVREASPANADERTPFGRFWAAVSGDELPQTKLIRQGKMAYNGGRLLRAEGHNLMVAGRYAEGYELLVSGRDPVLTPEEYALWLMFDHDALWTLHFPGCRQLEPQSPEFLLTRYLTIAIFDKIASKPLEAQYLDDVVRPYLRRQGVAAGRVLLHELAHYLPESCRTTTERLGTWALRGLGRRVGAEVREHLDNCAACRNTAALLPAAQSNSGERKLLVPPGPAGDGSTNHPSAPVRTTHATGAHAPAPSATVPPDQIPATPTQQDPDGHADIARVDPGATPHAANRPAPLAEPQDSGHGQRAAQQPGRIGPGVSYPQLVFDPTVALDLPPRRASGLDGLGFDPPPVVAEPFGDLPHGVVAHAANPADPNGGAFGGGRSRASRIARAALSTFRVEATLDELQNWAARLSDDDLHHLLIGFTHTVAELIAAIHRGEPPGVTDHLTNPARLLVAIVVEGTRRFGDGVPPSVPATYREFFATESWLRANRWTLVDLHSAMIAVLDVAYAVTRTSTVHHGAVSATHHTVPAHLGRIARRIEEAGRHSIWLEENSFPPDAALQAEHVRHAESFLGDEVRGRTMAQMVLDWSYVMNTLLQLRSGEAFSPGYEELFETLPIHVRAVGRARTGSDELFATTLANALPALLDAAFYLLPTSNFALGLKYLRQVDQLLAEAITRFADRSSAVHALQEAVDDIHKLYEDIVVADSARLPEQRMSQIHAALSDYFGDRSEFASTTGSFWWGLRALWGLGHQSPGIHYAREEYRLDAVLPWDWHTTDDERAFVETALDVLRKTHGPGADMGSLLHQGDSPDLVESVFDSVGKNMRWWYKIEKFASGYEPIGMLLSGATDYSVPEMHLAVLRQYPHIIGAAAGIDYRVRDLANRLSLARDLESLSIPPERRRELSVLREQLAEVQHQAFQLTIHDVGVPPVLLVSYDPVARGGTGRAVVSIGAADSASFMAFNITGADTPVTDLAQWSVGACQLYKEARQHGPADARLAIMLTVGKVDAPSRTVGPDATPMDHVVEARDFAGKLAARELVTYDATRELALDGSEERWSRMVRRSTAIGHGEGMGVLRSAADTLRLDRAVDQIVLVPDSAGDQLPTATQLNIGAEDVYTLNPHRDRNGDPKTIGLIVVGHGDEIESAPDASGLSTAPLIDTPTTVREISQLLSAHEYRPLEGRRGITMTHDEGLTVYRAAQPLLRDGLKGTYNTTVVLEELGLVVRIGQPGTDSYDPRFGPEHSTLLVISQYVRHAPQLLKVLTGRMPDGRVIDESSPVLIERLARGNNLAETFRRADRRTIQAHQGLILRTFANIHEQLRAMPDNHPLLHLLTPPGVAKDDTGGWYLNHIDWYTENFYRRHYERFGDLFDEFGLLRGDPFAPLIDEARSMRESRHHILHADPNAGNFLISNQLRVTLLDWELAVTGPSAYDWARLGHLIPGIEVPRELGGPDMVKFARVEKFKRVMNDTVKLAPLAVAGQLTPELIEFIETEFSEAVIQVRQLSGHTNLLPPRAELEILRSWRP